MRSRSRTVGPNSKIWVSNDFLGCPELPHQVSAKSVTGHKHPLRHTQKTTLNSTSVGSCWGLIMKQASALGGREQRLGRIYDYTLALNCEGEESMQCSPLRSSRQLCNGSKLGSFESNQLGPLRCLPPSTSLLRLANSISFTLLSLPLLSLPSTYMCIHLSDRHLHSAVK